MKTKLSKRFWCALTLFSLMGQVAWVVENMYLNVFIYKMFAATAGQISAMVAASAVAATLTTVLIGALSDRIGKRKLFICGGYILWGISILCFMLVREDVLTGLFPQIASAATLGVSLVIALDCLMTFFGSSANDAAFNAWLTDSTDSTNRGAAEGINAMMPLVAILVVFGGFMFSDLELASSWTAIFAIIGGVVLTVGVLGIFLIEDAPAAPSETGYFRNVVHGFLPKTVRENRSLYFYLGCFILFNIAIQIFMPYLIIYYEVSLGMKDYVFVMAPAIILASLVTALWGKVYDKKGFSFSSYIALLWLCLGFVLLFLCRSTLPVFLGSLCMMCGYLAGMAVFGAKIRDLTPVGQAGMFQGVRIFSQVLIPGIVGPFIGKTVLSNAETLTNSDGTESFVPNANIFLAALGVAALTLLVLIISGKMRKPRLTDLTTPFEEDLASSWETEYPRPQMQREGFTSLSGEWDLTLQNKKGALTPLGKIRVPFPPESRLSGIRRALRRGEAYIYSRTLLSEQDLAGKRLLLHFGAVDQVATLSVGGREVGTHTGGYLPFTFDITDYLVPGENLLSLTVRDPLDTDLPYGKQTHRRGGMWYTPVSGIWQPVWYEVVPQNYIENIKISTTCVGATVTVTGGVGTKTLTLHTEAGDKAYSFEGDTLTVTPEQPHLWLPEDPYLYTFTLTSGEDTVTSYFALREVSTASIGGKPCLTLNGAPYLFHGLLDQGYYPDGIYLPATPAGYEYDILKMKELGFNMLRKHIKIEPQVFYYLCDKHGMAVFQDMVNSGKYSFLVDTALPTLGKKRGITHKASPARRRQFEGDARETVALLQNHPSVVYYTIFNEGWGQYDADRIYKELKALDPSRIWDATSGWFWEQESDVLSEHIYFKRLNLPAQKEKPLVLSEFGGYSCNVEGHVFNLDKTYGYRTLNTTADLMDALEELYLGEVLPMLDRGLTATVLTQLSDVEDETNGIVTYDRRVVKVEPERMRAIAARLRARHAEVFRAK